MGGLTFKASRWVAMCWAVLSICLLGYWEPNSFKNVHAGPGPGPYFYRGPKSQTVISGEMVVLRCTLAEDNYQFWLSWQRDNVFLPLEDVMRDPITYSKSPDGITMGEYSLTIDSVTGYNAGQYRCVLVNGTGTGEPGEENPEVVLRSPTGSLIVVEPVTTTTTTTSTTPPLKGHFNNGHEFDSKGSVGVLPKSESEMESMEAEGVPTSGPGPNPPIFETASNNGDPHLLYYIIAGLLIVAIVFLLIIVTVLLFKTYNCTCRCPCKAGAEVPGLVQTQRNSNFSQQGREDVAREDVGVEGQAEPGASEFKMFENQEIIHLDPHFSNYAEELMYCSIHNPYVYQPSSFGAENEYSEVYASFDLDLDVNS